MKKMCALTDIVNDYFPKIWKIRAVACEIGQSGVFGGDFPLTTAIRVIFDFCEPSEVVRG